MVGRDMELNLDGYTLLPAGKLAAVVTYLEMTQPPAGLGPSGLALRRMDGAQIEVYREAFRRVGEPWLWFSRLLEGDAELAATLSDPQVEVWLLESGGGILELDRRTPGEVEISFFGLAAEAVGKGTGRQLMQHALWLAWAPGVRRVWLHTCTLDHPKALAFYRKAGFRPFLRAIEVSTDPRLLGKAPRDSAPQIPLL